MINKPLSIKHSKKKAFTVLSNIRTAFILSSVFKLVILHQIFYIRDTSYTDSRTMKYLIYGFQKEKFKFSKHNVSKL